MDQGCAGADRVLGAHHGGQHLVVDRDQFRGVARQCLGFGNDDRDALADMAHAIVCQWRALGPVALGARPCPLP